MTSPNVAGVNPGPNSSVMTQVDALMVDPAGNTGSPINAANLTGSLANATIPAGNVTGGSLANATIPAGNVTGSGGLLSLSLMPKWMQARGRVLAKTGGAKILMIGESTTRGNGSGGATGNMGLSYPTQLAQMLSARGLPASWNSFAGDGNYGGIANYTSQVDNRLVVGANWVSSAATTRQVLGGQDTINTSAGAVSAANTVTFTVTQSQFDTVDIYCFADATFSYTVSVDGGPVLQTVNVVPVIYNGVAGTALQKNTIAVPLGTHAINIVKSSGASGGPGAFDLSGIVAYNSTTPEVQVINAGISGGITGTAMMTGWNYTNTGGPYGWDRLSALAGGTFNVWAPDLTILSLMINDAVAATPLATYSASIQAIVTAALTSGDCLMMVGPPSSTSLQTDAIQRQYGAAALAVAAANNIVGVNFQQRWVSYANMTPAYADTIHPNGVGYADEAATLANLLMQ